MAKVIDNLVTEGLSGKLGRRLVFRKGRNGKTILATRPVYNADRQFNDAQLAQQEAFTQAATYAKVAKDNPVYVALAKGADATAYNLAVADWFGEPQVLSVEANGWTGEIGQTIQVRAKDDTKVTRVQVVFNDNGTILEQGEAIPSGTDGLLWIYTTRTSVPKTPTLVLIAEASDLAGNLGSSMISLN